MTPEQTKTIILKVGGSLLSPALPSADGIGFDFDYLKKFVEILMRSPHRVVLMIGGGKLNRVILSSLEDSLPGKQNENDLHTIGIASSVIHASIVKIHLEQRVDPKKVYPEVIKFDMYEELERKREQLLNSKFIVASGWKPGHSHDLDAVLFAEFFGATEFFSLKNIDGVYTADPKIDPTARRLAVMTWQEYEQIIVVKNHEPGASYPVDPIAARESEEKGLSCYVLDGRDLIEVEKIVLGYGTTKATRIG